MVRTRAAHLLSTTVVLLVLLAAGCHKDSSSGLDTELQVQYCNGAESANNQCIDAAVAALILASTNAVPPNDPVRTLSHLHQLPQPRARATLTRLVSSPFVVTLNQLLDVNGNKMFPALSGAFSILPSGTAVTSWPTGSNQQALGTATVVFNQGPVTYIDPGNGSFSSISLGSFTIALSSTYTYSSLNNWTFTLDTQVLIPQSSQVTWSLYASGTVVHTVTLYGFRHVNEVETRTNAGAVDNLQIVRTVDGTGIPGAAPGGSSQIDPTAPGAYFSSWIDTIDIVSDPVYINPFYRTENTTTTWDYTVTPALASQTIANQKIFMLVPGAPYGPYSNATLLAAYATLATN